MNDASSNLHSPVKAVIANAPRKPRKAPLRERSPILAHLRSVLLTGLLTAIPLFITIYIIAALFSLVTKFTKPAAEQIVKSVLAPPAGKCHHGVPPADRHHAGTGLEHFDLYRLHSGAAGHVLRRPPDPRPGRALHRKPAVDQGHLRHHQAGHRGVPQGRRRCGFSTRRAGAVPPRRHVDHRLCHQHRPRSPNRTAGPIASAASFP